jgi:hypothetical protein
MDMKIATEVGIRARLMVQVPVACNAHSSAAGHGAPAPSQAATKAPAQWTINPGQVPAGRTLALMPPPGANSGNSGNSGTAPGRVGDLHTFVQLAPPVGRRVWRALGVA